MSPTTSATHTRGIPNVVIARLQASHRIAQQAQAHHEALCGIVALTLGLDIEHEHWELDVEAGLFRKVEN